MAKWRIRSDKITSLRKMLNSAGMYGAAGVAAKIGYSESTVRRLFSDEGVGEEYVFKLFRVLLKLSIEGDIDERNRHRLDREVAEFCEEIPDPPKARRRPDKQKQEAAIFKPSDEAMALLSVYVKFIHLRDPRSQKPIYRKRITRLDEEVDVFSEYIEVVTAHFERPEKNYTFDAFALDGFVEMQPIFPAARNISYSEVQRVRSPYSIEHTVVGLTDIAQAARFMVNAFSPRVQSVNIFLNRECEKAVIVVDMTSLPVDGRKLMASPPTALHNTPLHSRGYRSVEMSCVETRTGVFMVDSTIPFADGWNAENTLSAKDMIQVQFSINWDALF